MKLPCCDDYKRVVAVYLNESGQVDQRIDTISKLISQTNADFLDQENLFDIRQMIEEAQNKRAILNSYFFGSEVGSLIDQEEIDCQISRLKREHDWIVSEFVDQVKEITEDEQS